ncbi:MAG TPA: FG-GAP-like repeat-containing protein [Terriglobales bacterium]|jgi:Tfp pilus assembly protein PilF|nr:FG-GAP-like repeat-containing protein [Terriglobales bacterium]
MAKLPILALILILFFALLAANGPSANPQEAARLNNIGVAYMNQQLFEKALKSFEAAAAADPALQITTVNRGVALLNLQRLDAAKALLEKAVKDNPNDAHAWYNLGLYYKNSSDAGAAVDAFRRVTEIDPNDADSWYFLGSTYAQLKQFPEAIEAFEHALKLDPHHASAQFGLARSYQQSGEADPAHEAMKKFQYITQNKLGAPISLAYGEQGKYSRAEESPQVVEKVPAQIPVTFVDVTAEAGLTSKDVPLQPGKHYPQAVLLGSGACFLDYDTDGRVDIFVADNGPDGGIGLFHNLGNGKFEDLTKKAGLDPALHGVGCTAGDYDNDGATDLAVSFDDQVMLLHNEKDGTFRDVTRKAGIKSGGFNSGLVFIDYDHDGDLDLYVSEATAPTSAEPLKQNVLDQMVHPPPPPPPDDVLHDDGRPGNRMWRNNGDGTFTDVTESTGLSSPASSTSAIGTDYNNDRAIDIVATGWHGSAAIFRNPREGKFPVHRPAIDFTSQKTVGVVASDFDHDGWMDLAFTHWAGKGEPAVTLWRNNRGNFEQVKFPETNWARAYGVAAIDYDNDGWVDLVAVGETKDGKGEVRLFRNLGPDGWKDVSADVGLDKIQLKEPRAIITGDYDNDGAVDLLITQNHGPAVLLRNEGGNKNNSLRLALKGLNDNKSAIGTKVEVFSGGLRQKFEVYGSSGYLGQNSPYLTIGLGQAKEADVVRMLWPTGVLQDEIGVAANKQQNILELDRRGSSCPTLFAWDGREYQLVGDMLGAGVVGHWISANGGKIERDIPRPTEAIKLDRTSLREKEGKLSFRFMEPLEESVYLDQVKLLAVDHPADVDVYPNEYFASNPPYPPFKVVYSNENDARPPAGAWDEHGHDVLPYLLAHRYFGDFKVLSFMGFAEPHSLILDLGEAYRGGPLWLLMHGEIEYYSANSMYAADQAHLRPIAPYVEALVATNGSSEKDGKKWVRVVGDMGFPGGGPRTMTADLSGKLPVGTRRIRITTNLQIYWDNILVSHTSQQQRARVTPVPLARADLNFHGFPLKIEDKPPGNVKYIYEKTSETGPYTRPAGAYTRYGDVRPLLESVDDKFVVFGSGDEVALDFDPATLPTLPRGWVRDYFFIANGYEKDMDFYAYRGDSVDPLPFRDMHTYPYPGQSFPTDAEHLNYLLEYNTRFMSGHEATGYSFRYPE